MGEEPANASEPQKEYSNYDSSTASSGKEYSSNAYSEPQKDSSNYDSSGSETASDPWELIPLNIVIDSRHAGTAGMLSNRNKNTLRKTTLEFLRKYNLKNKKYGANFIPRGYVNKYNSYLDRKIDQGLFSSPSRKKKRVHKIVRNISFTSRMMGIQLY